MKTELPTFQELLQKFFLQRLIQQRKVSGQTVNSYRDTFRIYFYLLSANYNIKAESVTLDYFDVEYIQGFCKYLEKNRGNKGVTINNRFADIHSFLKYVAEIEPEFSGIVKRSLMIPMQKHVIPTMDFITKDEFLTMINTCDTSTPIGSRDKLMQFCIWFNRAISSSLLNFDISCSSIMGL